MLWIIRMSSWIMSYDTLQRMSLQAVRGRLTHNNFTIKVAAQRALLLKEEWDSIFLLASRAIGSESLEPRGWWIQRCGFILYGCCRRSILWPNACTSTYSCRTRALQSSKAQYMPDPVIFIHWFVTPVEEIQESIYDRMVRVGFSHLVIASLKPVRFCHSFLPLWIHNMARFPKFSAR